MDSIAEVLNAEIKPENLGDLETLINLYEMHEEALKETKRTLMLKQQTCIMGYLTAYARDFKLAI